MTCAYVDTSLAYMPIGQKSLADALGLDDMAAALGTDHMANQNGLNSSEVTAPTLAVCSLHTTHANWIKGAKSANAVSLAVATCAKWDSTFYLGFYVCTRTL